MARRRVNKDFNEFYLEIAKGDVVGHEHIHKFGANKDIDIGTEDIWEHGGSVGYLTSASILNVASTDVDDTSAGNGMRTMVVEGLDENWEELSETVTMNGQTIVTTVNSYIRINRMYGVTFGDTDSNEGSVHIFTGTETLGEPDDLSLVYSQISNLQGQTLQAFYTVPANKTGYLLGGWMSTDAAAKPVEGHLFARRDADIATSGWRIQADFKTGDFFHREFQVPIPVDAKTDLRVDGKADANNTYVSAGFDIILVDN